MSDARRCGHCHCVLDRPLSFHNAAATLLYNIWRMRASPMLICVHCERFISMPWVRAGTTSRRPHRRWLARHIFFRFISRSVLCFVLLRHQQFVRPCEYIMRMSEGAKTVAVMPHYCHSYAKWMCEFNKYARPLKSQSLHHLFLILFYTLLLPPLLLQILVDLFFIIALFPSQLVYNIVLM